MEQKIMKLQKDLDSELASKEEIKKKQKEKFEK